MKYYIIARFVGGSVNTISYFNRLGAPPRTGSESVWVYDMARAERWNNSIDARMFLQTVFGKDYVNREVMIVEIHDDMIDKAIKTLEKRKNHG